MNRRHPSPAELAEGLREVISALRRRAQAERADEATPGQTLPDPQLAVLKRLEVDGPATTADLARAELITPQSMGALVAALEAAGHVTRRPDAKDGRRRLAALTAAGRSALALNRAARMRWLADDLAARFDADEQRAIAVAVSLLRRLIPRKKES